MKKLQKGIELTEFRKDIRRYIDSKEQMDCNDDASNMISDSSQIEIDYHSITKDLLSGRKVFIYGERGIGKTTIVKKVYNFLLSSLELSLSSGQEDLFVPIYADLEVLWGCGRVIFINVLYTICNRTNLPYCVDRSVHYIILLDGEMRRSRGYLPEAIDSFLDHRSGIHSLLIAQTELQFYLRQTFRVILLKHYRFQRLLDILLKNLAEV